VGVCQIWDVLEKICSKNRPPRGKGCGIRGDKGEHFWGKTSQKTPRLKKRLLALRPGKASPPKGPSAALSTKTLAEL